MSDNGSREQMINTTYARCLNGRVETIWFDKALAHKKGSVRHLSSQLTKRISRWRIALPTTIRPQESSQRLFHFQIKINKDLTLMDENIQPSTSREMI
eukprot:scaffold23394_cov42-Cyclotella_meneghiniana.AAC.11